MRKIGLGFYYRVYLYFKFENIDIKVLMIFSFFSYKDDCILIKDYFLM